jgi:hypothetical protein
MEREKGLNPLLSNMIHCHTHALKFNDDEVAFPTKKSATWIGTERGKRVIS